MRGRRRDGDGGRGGGGGGAACSNVMRRDIKEGGVRGRETRRSEGEERRRRKEKRSKVRKKSCWWRLILNTSEEKCQRRTGERTEPPGHLADQSVTSPVSQRARQPITRIAREPQPIPSRGDAAAASRHRRRGHSGASSAWVSVCQGFTRLTTTSSAPRLTREH